MRIALIFDRTRPDTTGIYFERACRVLGLAAEHWWLREASKIPSGYDLYLRVDHGDDYLTPLPDQLRPAVFYAIDTHLPTSLRKVRRMASRYDLVFCAHREGSRRLRGAEWLPLACDEEWHGAAEASAVWDLAFVGNDGGVPRKFYLQALRERYPNSCIGQADHTRLGAIYSRARIGLNYSVANDVNMRIFEVLAAGTLLLTNALRGDDLGQLGLEDRYHLVVYRSPRELIDLIDFYLAHPEQRQVIAQQGAQRVCGQHTYAHRMVQLLTTVSQRLGVSVPPLAVPEKGSDPTAETLVVPSRGSDP